MVRCTSFEKHPIMLWVRVICIVFCFMLYVDAQSNDQSQDDNHDANLINENAHAHNTDQFEEEKSSYVDESGDAKSNSGDEDSNVKSSYVDEPGDDNFGVVVEPSDIKSSNAEESGDINYNVADEPAGVDSSTADESGAVKSTTADESDEIKSNYDDESGHIKFENIDPPDNVNYNDVVNVTYTAENLNMTMETSTVEVVNSSSINGSFISNGTEGNLNSTEGSSNSSSKPTIRWPCKPYPLVDNNTSLSPSVLIINNETKLGNIIFSLNGSKECALVLFYSPYCEFCTTMAPLYNAVGRSYSNLIVVASDAQKVMGMSARYGIVGIPTVLFFYSGKAVAKYNRSRTVSDFHEFILELTGLLPSIPLNITSDDDVGPIVTTPKESRDYYLIFSIIFLVLFFIVKVLGSFLKRLFINSIVAVKSLFRREKVE